jgi:hypothetical protein
LWYLNPSDANQNVSETVRNTSDEITRLMLLFKSLTVLEKRMLWAFVGIEKATYNGLADADVRDDRLQEALEGYYLR